MKQELNSKVLCGITPENIIELEPNEIFVFGSNLKGIHGAGAALTARIKFKAKLGVGEGFTGQCYALPTKDFNINTLPVEKIQTYISALYEQIKQNNHKHFLITKIGCGYAGYTINDIAPLFSEFIQLSNCSLPAEFIKIIINVP